MLDAIRALAFVGDLSMGQPVDHSSRTAALAGRLARASRGDDDHDAPAHAACVALLRWSGCTANAPEFAALLGDDVGGRDAMLTTTSASVAATFAGSVSELAQIHCEVSGEIARILGLPPEVEQPLRHIFETYDGRGTPAGLSALHIPACVFEVALSGDLEIFSRTYGLAAALRYIGERADARYPAALVRIVQANAAAWLDELGEGEHERTTSPASSSLETLDTPLELVADVIDLKLPWMTGFSRRVAEAALGAARTLALDEHLHARLYRAGLIHGIGRASVPNALWSADRRHGEADLERLRLAPYWTSRAARRLPTLAEEVELASFAHERLDGSGAFRGARGPAIDLPARLLSAAAHWIWLQTGQPGRSALSAADALHALREEARLGRFDIAAVDALAGMPSHKAAAPPSAASPLSAREIEVLARVSLGESNKSAAKTLGISPSTVRTHMESAFRKLGCSTRAAATLKAMTLGLLPASP